jgi:hypothetical protein
VTQDELYERIFASPMFERWHWFGYHFEKKLRGESEPFAESIVEACLACEAVMPGYAARMIDALTAIGGRNRDRRDYQQLLQVLAELLVVRQLATYPWPYPVKFACDPTPLAGSKNPELTIETPTNLIGVEVKAPALLEHEQLRASREVQAPSRRLSLEELEKLAGGREELTLPRDNPLKDFLISAEAKFEPFTDEHENFVGALVIVWDDHVYEPITALEHPASGLFTPNSFALDDQRQPLTFPSVDGVVLIRHLHQFVNAAGGRPMVDSIQHALDYGRAGEFPPKPYVASPDGVGLPAELLDALQAIDYRKLPGAEHSISDLVFWFDNE